MVNSTSYDVIIIGSGLGGLECGTILSRHGLKVLVLERQIQPGGCMQSYKRKDCVFDTGLHYVGGLGKGQTLYPVFKYLGLLDLPWTHLDEDAFDTITIAGETFSFAEGYERFAEKMSERFPAEKEALFEYVDMLRRADEVQLLALTEDVPPESSLTDKLFSTNAYDWLHEKFHDELLINVLSGTSLKMELKKDTLPLFTFSHGNSGFIQSSWRLDGDGNMLVQKLVDEIKKYGGEVLCNTEVIELVEKEGRIVTALCANGKQYSAETFICNTHPVVTCSLVKESTMMRGIYKKRITRLQNTFGMFTCSLKIKNGSIPNFNHNKFVYEKANVWELSEEDHEGMGILITNPKENSLDILTPMLWSECQQWENTTVGHRGEDYRAMKAAKAERCVALAETVIPGLRDAIEEIYTSTPLTYRDYNLTPEGSAYGIRKDCTAPMMTILTPRTPIPNLLMTGQNLMLHGLHGVTMTTLFTCAEILGREPIRKIINNVE
ncbi:MAG: NAD(P)/FAD-dependent oxidoreductase [Prevotella sp.]|nr:NAD(P)/FAD-dependent oxidoreductase [Candidatus Prevotella equi]